MSIFDKMSDSFDKVSDSLSQKGAEISKNLQLRRQAGDMDMALTENARQDAKRYPEMAELIERLLPRVRTALEKSFRAAEKGPVNASVLMYVAPDNMLVCVCILPALEGGRRMEWEEYSQLMTSHGVVFGVDEELSKKELNSKFALRFFPAAKGRLAQDGVDGTVTPLFQKSGLAPEALFKKGLPPLDADAVQPIFAGDRICTIQAAVAGVPGMDVTGKELFCISGADPKVPAGENTGLTSDGSALVAAVDGLLCLRKGLWSVAPMQLLAGPVQGSPKLADGDLYVQGDIVQGARLNVKGNLIVSGSVRGAELQADGHIRVQKEISGGKISVDGCLQAGTVCDVQIDAEQGLYVEQLSKCNVICSGPVMADRGDGIIVDSTISAQERVSCLILDGSHGKTRISVGITREMVKEMESLDAELKEIGETLEMLRKHIASLRVVGDSLSPEKRTLLERLTEQRDLYEGMERRSNRLRSDLRDELIKARSGRIVCRELRPDVAVQIGDKSQVLRTNETSCNIHVYMGDIVVK